MANARKKTGKLVNKVQAQSYGVALTVARHATQATQPGKPYGKSRAKIAAQMKSNRQTVRAKYPKARGLHSADPGHHRIGF